MAIIRRRKAGDTQPSQSNEEGEEGDGNRNVPKTKKLNAKKKRGCLNCINGCCWFIGVICSMWWFLLFLYKAMPSSIPQYVTEAITGPIPDPPGVKLKKEGLIAKHPVVFVPGIVTGGLELWEGHECAEDLFRKRLWGGNFGQIYKRYMLLFFPLSFRFFCQFTSLGQFYLVIRKLQSI